jgi:hypothetical protein
LIQTLTLASTLATSQDDKKLDLSDIQIMLNQLNQFILPLGVNQDPRIPPQGRIIAGSIVEIPGGEFELRGQAELFGNDLGQLSQQQDKELKIKLFAEPTIIYDSYYSGALEQEKIYDLKVTLKGNSEQEIRRKNDAFSVLIVGMNQAMGNIYKGFQKIYSKSEIKEICQLLGLLLLRNTPDEERILSFQNTLKHGNTFINVEILLTNPEPRDIERFFTKALKKFDTLLTKHYHVGKGIRKMVYFYHKGDFEFKFVLLKNGIPMVPQRKS